MIFTNVNAAFAYAIPICLEARELERLLAPQPHGLPGLDFVAAAAWVERELGDAELSRLVREEAARGSSYVNRCLGIHALVAGRLTQVREAAGEDAYPAGKKS